MSVGRFCTRYVDLADAGETVQAAVHRMFERRAGTLAILDADRPPVGIVTDRDLVVRVLALGKDPRQTRVDAVMTLDPWTVSEETPIEQALALMRSGGFRWLRATGGDGSLVGLLTIVHPPREAVATAGLPGPPRRLGLERRDRSWVVGTGGFVEIFAPRRQHPEPAAWNPSGRSPGEWRGSLGPPLTLAPGLPGHFLIDPLDQGC